MAVERCVVGRQRAPGEVGRFLLTFSGFFSSRCRVPKKKLACRENVERVFFLRAERASARTVEYGGHV